jgi:electron transport complex protein RnfG
MNSKLIKILIGCGIVLCAIALFLSFVQRLGSSEDAVSKSFKEQEFFKEVFPNGVIFEPVFEKDILSYYRVLSREKRLLGYVFQVKKWGYVSDIVTLVGMTSSGVITRIKILSQKETYGIGSRVVDDEKALNVSAGRFWFQDQFRGKTVNGLNSSIDAVTGATATSRAVIDSISERAQEILSKVK